jgi:hypothetical protein
MRSTICIAPWSWRVVRISTVVMVSMVSGNINIIPNTARNPWNCRIYSSFVVYSIIQSIDAIYIWNCQSEGLWYCTLWNKHWKFAQSLFSVFSYLIFSAFTEESDTSKLYFTIYHVYGNYHSICNWIFICSVGFDYDI